MLTEETSVRYRDPLEDLLDWNGKKQTAQERARLAALDALTRRAGVEPCE